MFSKTDSIRLHLLHTCTTGMKSRPKVDTVYQSTFAISPQEDRSHLKTEGSVRTDHALLWSTLSAALFSPIMEWVQTERAVLQKINVSKLNGNDLHRIWNLITEEFEDLHRGLKVAFLGLVRETHALAHIELHRFSYHL